MPRVPHYLRHRPELVVVSGLVSVDTGAQIKFQKALIIVGQGFERQHNIAGTLLEVFEHDERARGTVEDLGSEAVDRHAISMPERLAQDNLKVPCQAVKA